MLKPCPICNKEMSLSDIRPSGIYWRDNKEEGFSQMYGHCNSRVSDEMHKAAKKLIKDLNQEINE